MGPIIVYFSPLRVIFQLDGLKERNMKKFTLDQYIEKRKQVIALYKKGVPKRQISREIEVNIHAVREWIAMYEDGKYKELLSIKLGKANPKITRKQRSQLMDILLSSPTEHGFSEKEWTPTMVRKVLKDKIGVEYALNSINPLLAKMGLHARNIHERRCLPKLYKIVTTRKPFQEGLIGTYWNAQLVAELAEKKFNRKYTKGYIERYLRDRGYHFYDQFEENKDKTAT